MATFTFTLQGTSPTTITSGSDVIEFCGSGGFGTTIATGSYNDTTHVRTNPSTDKSSGNTPRNNKFISQAGGTGGDSQADWGDGTEDIDAVLDAECALKINFADASSVSTSSAIFYSYDGTTETTPASNLDVRAAESGDANFSSPEGKGTDDLTLTDQGASTSHDFYILLSVSPSAVGLNTSLGFKIELTYS